MIERKGDIPDLDFGVAVGRFANRAELARHLYVVEPCGPDVHLTLAEQNAGAEEWDEGGAKPEDVADCYERADRMIAEGLVAQ